LTMRATILLLLALAVVCVSAQDTVTTVPPAVNVTGADQLSPSPDNPVGLPPAAAGTVPANITTPAQRNATKLVQPIIWSGPRSRDPGVPLTGKPPKHLKKAHVTKHIFGGAVEFIKGKTRGGCPCKIRAKEKHRYDVELRDRPRKVRSCRCRKGKKGKKAKRRIPPVIAALYPTHHRRGGRKGRKGRKARKGKKGKKGRKSRKGCKKPKREMIKPEYRPRARKEKKAHPCKKDGKKKKHHVTPEFYPSKGHKHKGIIVRRRLRANNKKRKNKKN